MVWEWEWGRMLNAMGIRAEKEMTVGFVKVSADLHRKKKLCQDLFLFSRRRILPVIEHSEKKYEKSV